jgi:hypothetical protein
VGHGSTLARDFLRRLCVANRFESVSCVTSPESQGQRYGYASGGRGLRVFPGLREILADTKVRPTKKAAPAAVALSEKSWFFRFPRSSKLGGTSGGLKTIGTSHVVLRLMLFFAAACRAASVSLSSGRRGSNFARRRGGILHSKAPAS